MVLWKQGFIGFKSTTGDEDHALEHVRPLKMTRSASSDSICGTHQRVHAGRGPPNGRSPCQGNREITVGQPLVQLVYQEALIAPYEALLPGWLQEFEQITSADVHRPQSGKRIASKLIVGIFRGVAIHERS